MTKRFFGLGLVPAVLLLVVCFFGFKWLFHDEVALVGQAKSEGSPVTRSEGAPPVSSPVAASNSFQSEIPSAPVSSGVPQRFAQSKELARREMPAGPGAWSRIRVLKTDLKYPRIRVEETVERTSGVAGGERVVRQVAMVADHVVVKLNPTVSEDALSVRLKELGYGFGGRVVDGYYLVALPDAGVSSVPRAIDRLSSERAFVAYAEPDYLAWAETTPDDASFGEQWSFENTGQGGGTPDADVDATEAWDLTTGDTNVIVAVLDTGIDYEHEDLAPQAWFNSAESGPFSTNALDDDGNGYTNDWRGWDFYYGDNNPMDGDGHGTHCSGIIGAVGDNGIGVAGICWRVRIMPLKIMSDDACGKLSFLTDVMRAIEYAVRKGAKILSNSYWFSTEGYSQGVADMITMACSKGVLFVASAGNYTQNNDVVGHYPSNYTNANVIAVASTTNNDHLSDFSNYGSNSVDLAAPGSAILSTIPGSMYGYKSGTSMAAPHVAGAAALLWAYDSTLSMEAVKAALLDSVDTNEWLAGKVLSGGRLNIAKALRSIEGLRMDQAEYFVNSWITLSLVSTGLSGTFTRIACVSATSGDIEYVALSERPGSAGVFTGRLWLAEATTATNENGWLEATHGTVITARHVYASAGITNEAVACVNHQLQVVITTEPSVLTSGVTSVRLWGFNNGNASVAMTVSNALTGQVIPFVATNDWATPAINLTNGYNTLWVFGSNVHGFIDSDSVTITRRGGPSGVTNHVSLTGSHQWPFLTWATAATSIQEAVYATMTGNVVLVTNGTYLINDEVSVDGAFMVRSVNGYSGTVVQAADSTRCFNLHWQAQLAGFTITSGRTSNGGGVYGGTISNCLIAGNHADGGGGVSDSTVWNCLIISNTAYGWINVDEYAIYTPEGGGGGAANCTLHNCVLFGNSAAIGGGAAYSTLANCTVAGNSAYGVSYTIEEVPEFPMFYTVYGGGLFGGDVVNSIVWSNSPDQYPGWEAMYLMQYCVFRYTCTDPLPGGDGNVAVDPLFADFSAGNLRLLSNSPCIEAGTNENLTLDAMDLDGNPRLNRLRVDLGAYEYQYPPAPLLLAFTPGGLGVTNNATATTFRGTDFGRHVIGSALTNRLLLTNAGLATLNFTSCATGGLGAAQFRLLGLPSSLAVGQCATVGVRFAPSGFTNYEAQLDLGHDAANSASPFVINLRGWGRSTATAEIFHVAKDNPGALWPYTNWMTAAADIQSAIEATLDGDTVLVSNGIYGTGGRVVSGGITNRVAITKAVSVQSVNGPEESVIRGAWDPATTNGAAAVRCVYMVDGARLTGFTLTNGATQASYGEGGGAECESTNSIISNCVFAGNSASYAGGGAYNGNLWNCRLYGNFSQSYGGGAAYGSRYNCLFESNSAYYGGGCYYGNSYNCTIVGNTATNGGGSYYGTLYNCIVYFNAAPSSSNYSSGSFYYSDSAPVPSGTGNTAADPKFVDRSAGNYRLLSNSPCVNTGTNLSWMAGALDLDGRRRISRSYQRVDMGAYEYAYSAAGEMFVYGANGMAISNGAPASEVAGTDFGIIAPGQVVTNVLVVTNAGEQTLVLNDWTTNGVGASAFTLSGVMPSLAPGEAVALNIRFAPLVFMTYTAAVYIAHDAINQTNPFVLYLVGMARPAGAATLYVAKDNPGAAMPYTNWSMAAADIQSAIDFSLAGDTILVSNGVYDAGGRANFPPGSALTNRVAIHKPVSVWSVNGPEVTSIKGAWHLSATNGNAAIRCVYMTNGATLAGFTLTNGATRQESGHGGYGGGVWCQSTNAWISNCVLSANAAYYYGGGAYYGSLDNCLLVGNTAGENGGGGYYSLIQHSRLISNRSSYGGGAYGGTACNSFFRGNRASVSGGGASGVRLVNSTLAGNTAVTSGGGTRDGSMFNCIVWYNQAGSGTNYNGTACTNSCTTPLPAGTNNIDVEPGMVSIGNPRLLSVSPCINVGSNNTWMAGTTDLDGRPRVVGSAVDIGAYEYTAGVQTGALSVAIGVTYTNVPVGYLLTFQSVIEGECMGYRWSWGDGQETSDAAEVTRSYAGAGDFPVVLRASNLTMSAAATVTVSIVEGVYYVSLSGGHVSPFTSWATAATNIQDAIDAVNIPGAVVLVSNGVYATGGRVMYGSLTNRVVIDKEVTVKSVNGPSVTQISGNANPATTNGNAAVRGVYMTNGAVLVGFTVTNGHTRTAGNTLREQSGGGVWCESASAVISNCIMTGNSAFYYGGACYSGTLYNCTLSGNSASYYGGGSYYGTLYNCTLSGNSASSRGGGSYYGTLYNSILYYNTAPNGTNYYRSTLSFSCATPLASGTSNITDAPGFVDYSAGNLGLTSNSPCINAGTNQAWMAGSLDLDGNPRLSPAGGRVDMGAYEYVWADGSIPPEWLLRHNLPVDGSANFFDSDGDGFNNWQEWRCDTVPTTKSSALQFDGIMRLRAPDGAIIRWASTNSRTYALSRCTNLLFQPPFQPLVTGITGQAYSTSYTDTTTVGHGPWIYRIEVE